MSVDATRWAWMQENMRASLKIILLSLADRANEKNICWPSYERLRKDTGLDVRTIKSSLDALAHKGYIERHYSDGRGYTYRLLGVENREDILGENSRRGSSFPKNTGHEKAGDKIAGGKIAGDIIAGGMNTNNQKDGSINAGLGNAGLGNAGLGNAESQNIYGANTEHQKAGGIKAGDKIASGMNTNNLNTGNINAGNINSGKINTENRNTGGIKAEGIKAPSQNCPPTPYKNVSRPPAKMHTESKRESKKNLKASYAQAPDGHRAVAGTLVCLFEIAEARRKKGEAPPAKDLTKYFLPVKSPGMRQVVYLKALNWEQWAKLYGEDLCLQCLGRAYRWLLDNPTRAKTAQGIHRFFGNWLSREQDKGASRRFLPSPKEGAVSSEALLSKAEETLRRRRERRERREG